jgi:adenosylcobinamide-phosphate synthase
VFGDPVRFHPVAGFGTIAGAVERSTWRPSRVAGAIHAAALVGTTYVLARGARRRSVAASLVVWVTVGGRSLERAAEALADALAAGDLEQARLLAPTLVGRDPSELDARELSRAAIESVAENTSDAVVAPLLWAALFGPGAAAAYRAVNTLDAMVGHKDERYLRFGWASARLDDLANWGPARLTAALAALCAPLVGGMPADSWRHAFGEGARRHPSPNAGRVEGAFAGALGIRLGGTNRYAHGVEQRAQLGDGRPPEIADIARAVRLARAVSVAALAVCLLIAERE